MPDRVGGRRPSGYGGEVSVHAGAASLGAGLSVVLVGSVVPGLIWRAAALSVALSLVVVALVRALRLGRAEWQRESPTRLDYQRVIGRFGVAFVLVLSASS